MNLEKAYKKMAILMKKEVDFYRDNIGDVENMESDSNINEKIFKERELLRKDVEIFGDELASYSHIYSILIGNMVDIHGKGGEGGEEDVEKVLENIDFEDFIEKQGGIPSTIQQSIKEWGFEITDRGGSGCGHWHLGVPCNNNEADRLCSLLHYYFINLIRKDIIRIERHHWGYRLPGLYNWNELEKWLKNNNID